MFFKTKYSLKSQRNSPSWTTPKSDNFTGLLNAQGDTFYEICLSVVDSSELLYYLHINHCVELRTPELRTEKHEMPTTAVIPTQGPASLVKTTFVNVSAESRSITVAWKVQLSVKDPGTPQTNQTVSLIRSISIRPFASQNVSQLFVLEDFNVSESGSSSRYYTLPNLQPATPYVVCFETLKNVKEKTSTSEETCMESTTKVDGEGIGFPVAEVAAATAVSTSATAIIVTIMCCCFPGFCGGKRASKNLKESSEEDDNNNNHQGNKVELSNGEGNKVRAQLKKSPDRSLGSVSSQATAPIASIKPSGSSSCSYVEVEAEYDHRYPSSNNISSRKRRLMQQRCCIEDEPDSPATAIKNATDPSNSSGEHKGLKFWRSCLSGSNHPQIDDQNETGSGPSSSLCCSQQINLEDGSSGIEDSVAGSVEEEVILEETQDGIRIKSMSHKLEPAMHTLPRVKPERKIKEEFCHDCSSNYEPPHLPQYNSLPPQKTGKKPKNMARSIPPPYPKVDLMTTYDGQRPEVLPVPSYGAPGSYHTIAHYSYFKRPVPMEYYSPDYYRMMRPRMVGMNAQTLGRTRKEAKAMAKVQGQQPSKLKKFLLKNSPPSNDQFKMYTWSPYNQDCSHFASPSISSPFSSYQESSSFIPMHHPSPFRKHYPHHIVQQMNPDGKTGKKLNDLRF